MTNFTISYDTNKIGFLKTSEITYKFDNLKVLDIELSTNNFVSNSILLNIKNIETNQIIFEVKSFETKEFFIPSFTLKAEISNKTNEILIPEQKVTYEEAKIKVTNKQPIEGIYNFIDPMWFIIPSFLIIAGILGFILFKFFKKSKKKEENPEIVKIDPLDKFKQNIEEIKNIPFSEKTYKEIFVKISEATREFLENVYNFNALEMGTREILQYFKKLKDIEHKEEIIEIISHIFKICDRVKFAKHIPTIEEKDICIKECENIINLVDKKEDNII
ncbi:MAG: hypothetical protein N2258_02440 [Brevinematales bacterium]|nr:hypothetical protein [Brevinematales bacterium]